MGAREGTCNWCGKEFKYTGRGTLRYCSDECRSKGKESSYQKTLARERQKTLERKYKEERTIENANAETMALAAEAMEHGMSYGRYVAYLESEAAK